MRLISWNLNRRTSVGAQVAALAARDPDVVALQEITRSTVQPLMDELRRAGLAYAADSLGALEASAAKGPRAFGLLTASRWPLGAEPTDPALVPWPERLLSVRLSVPGGHQVEVHNAHVPPGSSNGWIKVDVLRGIYQRLATQSPHPRILCGDFNCPQEETPDGETVTWAQRYRHGRWTLARRIRGRPAAAWDAAERGIVTGLAAFDLPDVYRLLHGFATTPRSWVTRYRGNPIGRRFDHIFASRALRPAQCCYLDDLRLAGGGRPLSDHLPMEAVFESPAVVTCRPGCRTARSRVARVRGAGVWC